MDPRQLSNRFAGAIVGFAVGDALGMPVQYLSREHIYRYYGSPISTFVRAHEGHASHFLPKGSYTDDTQLMLATAECLIECRRMDPARQADTLLSWFRNILPRRTPMRAVELACKNLSTGRPWSKSGVFSGSCGAAMRMTPIGLVFYRNLEILQRAALDNCIITHNEPRARAGALAVACLTARLLQSNELSSPGAQVLETADRISSIDGDVASMLRWVTQIVHLPAEEALFEIGTSSDAIELVPAAVYCFLKYSRDFRSAVLTAVNAGDATDSVGALVGSFVGAFAGIESIPEQWRQEIENRDLLMGVAEQLVTLAETADIRNAII